MSALLSKLRLKEREPRRLRLLEVADQGCDAQLPLVQAVPHADGNARAPLDGPLSERSRPIDPRWVARQPVVVEERVTSPGQPTTKAGVSVGVLPGVPSSSLRER